jgi:crotonobetainyl-CoA:carnitine CoA-transferase CaiB-like acyl-CoA transferase
VAQATGGGMSITGTDPEHPVRSGIPIGDLGGGMFAVMGIQAALIERERSGLGQHVDISMLDCQISMLNYMATMYFLSGKDPYPLGNAHTAHVPYNTYRTADGFIVVAVITDNFWENLKQVVDYPEFANQKYDSRDGRLAARELIDGTLANIFRVHPTSYWVQQLEEKRIPCAPVNRLSEALDDPQVRHRNMVVPLKHHGGRSTLGPGNPVKLSRTSEESFSEAPAVGQHTDAVLRDLLGYDQCRLASLRQQQAVG